MERKVEDDRKILACLGMRDKTHIEQVERWANYVKENPLKWKKELKPFLDAQIIMARRFYKKLAETPEGREKIRKLWEKKIL